MARKLNEVSNTLNEILLDKLPQELLEKYNSLAKRPKFKVKFYLNAYLKAQQQALVLRKQSVQADINGIKRAFINYNIFYTKDIIAFLRSVQGRNLVKDFIANIYPKGCDGNISLFAKKQHLIHSQNVIDATIDILTQRQAIKKRLQIFYDKLQPSGIDRIKLILRKNHRKIYPQITGDEITDVISENAELIKKITLRERHLKSLSDTLFMYYDYYSDAPAEIKKKFKSCIQDVRKQAYTLENKIKKDVAQLYLNIDNHIFEQQAKQFFYQQTGNKKKVSYVNCQQFILKFPQNKRREDVFIIVKGCLQHSLIDIYQKHNFNEHGSAYWLEEHLCSPVLRNVYSNAAKMDLVIPRNEKPQGAVEYSVHWTKKVIPVSSRFIDAIPAGMLVSAGAITREFMDKVGCHDHVALAGVRSLSDVIEKGAEVKSETMDKTNTALEYVHGHGDNSTFSPDLVAGLGLVALSAKVVNNSIGLINSIGDSLKLATKKDLLLEAIATTFDAKLWQTIDVLQHNAKKTGMINSTDSECISRGFCGNLYNYDPRKGFKHWFEKVIKTIASSFYQSISRARKGELGIIELMALLGLLVDKPGNEISSFEIDMINQQIMKKQQQLDSILGIDYLTEKSSYRHYLMANKAAMDGVAAAVFSLTRLHNVSVAQNKEVTFAVFKTALSAASLAIAGVSVSGIGGFALGVLPGLLDGVDRLANVIYINTNHNVANLKKIGASIHASEYTATLLQSSDKVKMLYGVFNLTIKDYPGNILLARSLLVKKLKKHELRDDRFDEYKSNILMLQTLHQELDKLNKAKLNIDSHDDIQQKIYQKEIATIKQSIIKIQHVNTHIVNCSVDHGHSALEFFDQSVYTMLLQPLLGVFIKGLQTAKMPSGILLTDGDKIYFKQTVAKMRNYLDKADVINKYIICRDLLAIAKHNGHHVYFKKILENLLNSEEMMGVNRQVQANILYYRAMVTSSKHDAAQLMLKYESLGESIQQVKNTDITGIATSIIDEARTLEKTKIKP